MTTFDRRTVLRAGGVALTAAVAGCLSGNNFGDDLESHLEDVGNYDGTIEDHTGESEVTVQNGDVSGISQTYVFEPPAIRINQGTTVTWSWSGTAGHSVTEENETFDSGVRSGPGESFSYEFDETGTYLYVCSPHSGLGQKGAVVVE